jgi:hypothetical protein
MRLLPRVLLAVFVGLLHARADHGKDFALLDDYYLPEPLSGTLVGDFDWTDLPGDDELAFEQGILFGLAPRFGAGLNIRFADRGDGSWDYDSITPSAQVQLTPPDSDFPLRMALSLAYTFAEGHGNESHDHDGHAHGDNPIPCGPEFGPDALPCDDPLFVDQGGHNHAPKEGHAHEGIHLHGENAFRGRLIAQAALPHDILIVGNLIAVIPDDGGPAWGYGIGIRHAFNHDFAMGVEATGDFASDGQHTVLAGLYQNIGHELTLKLAAGARFADDDAHPTVVCGYTWRF